MFGLRKNGIFLRFARLNAHMLRSSRDLSKSKKSRAGNKIDESKKVRATRSSLNLSEPHEWYPNARRLQRRFVLHQGPTNSGKTFRALTVLATSERGIYLAPLRLLAAEVAEKLRTDGIRCDLITGQERDIDADEQRLAQSKLFKSLKNDSPNNDDNEYDYSAFEEVNSPHFSDLLSETESGGQHHVSCTIEMAGVYTSRNWKRRPPFDVAIVDEGQLLGDPSRGWAWTQAILGLPAREIHICGSPDMLNLVKALVSRCGDTVEQIHTYERLNPLEIAPQAIGSFKGTIKPGDCIVAFSRNELYKLKKIIERQNKGIIASMIYGALPPASRHEQVRRFNDPHAPENILISTDAIGMGLNLAVRRIVFSTTTKFDGRRRRNLTKSEITQISGRAGRYLVAGAPSDTTHGTPGIVTSLHEEDLVKVRDALSTARRPGYRAGLFPTLEQLELLGLFIDYGVEANAECLLNLVSDEVDLAAPEAIFKHFGSVSNFSLALEQHLFASGAISAAQHRKLSRKRSSRLAKLPPGAAREPLLVSLADLYTAFADAAELDQSGLYRLCILDEVVELSRICVDLPLSFSDRYVWSLAPVNIDNAEVIKYYRTFAEQFSSQSRVSLPIRLERRPIPTSEEELLEVEGLHNVCDLYLWLAQRFQTSFPDKERAIEQAALASNLVNAFLAQGGRRAPLPEDEELEDDSEDGIELREEWRKTVAPSARSSPGRAQKASISTPQKMRHAKKR